jgi:hypothetical protein
MIPAKVFKILICVTKPWHVFEVGLWILLNQGKNKLKVSLPLK